MTDEHMEDLAKLYAPSAARCSRSGHWEQAVSLLLERCQKLDMALQSLTPGGSEYVGEPDRCVAHAEATIDRYRSMWRAELRKLRAENARMREALEIITGMRQCADNLMSNGDVARCALAARPKQED